MGQETAYAPLLFRAQIRLGGWVREKFILIVFQYRKEWGPPNVASRTISPPHWVSGDAALIVKAMTGLVGQILQCIYSIHCFISLQCLMSKLCLLRSPSVNFRA